MIPINKRPAKTDNTILFIEVFSNILRRSCQSTWEKMFINRVIKKTDEQKGKTLTVKEELPESMINCAL